MDTCNSPKSVSRKGARFIPCEFTPDKAILIIHVHGQQQYSVATLAASRVLDRFIKTSNRIPSKIIAFERIPQHACLENKLDLSLNDERSPEKTKSRLVLKHFGGTSQEKLRHRKGNSELEKDATVQGFYRSTNQPDREESRSRQGGQKIVPNSTTANGSKRFEYPQSSITPKTQRAVDQLKKEVNFDPAYKREEEENPYTVKMRSTTTYPRQRIQNRLPSSDDIYKQAQTLEPQSEQDLQSQLAQTPSTSKNLKDTLRGFYSTQKSDAPYANDLSVASDGNNQRSASSSQNQHYSQQQQQPACFKVDYNFLDNISMDDPKLLKLVNDDVLKSKNIDLEAIIEENADYFHHLFGNCACFKCQCGRCRCQSTRMKIIYRNGHATSYHSQYSQMQKLSSTFTPPLNQTFYESLAALKRTQATLDPTHTTTHKKDYTAPDHQAKERKPDYQHVKVPFLATSHYKSNFIDWKEYDPTYVFKRPPHNSVVTEHPMRTKTTYKQLFRDDQDKIDNASAADVKQLQKNQPLPNTYSDEKPTEYTKTFKNANPKDLPSSKLPYKYLTETEQFNSIPQWKTQYKSINHNDFQQSKDPKCPTVYNNMTKPWKLKLMQKLKQMGVGGSTLRSGRSPSPANAGDTAASMISAKSSITKRFARSTALPHH